MEKQIFEINTAEIRINELRLWGYHGVTEEERKIGSECVLNLSMKVSKSQFDADKSLIDGSIDYGVACQCVTQAFAYPTPTLEQVAQRILNALFTQFSNLETATIEVKKLNPPMQSDCESASVVLTATRI